MQIVIGVIAFALGVLLGQYLKRYKNIGRFMINDGDPQRPAFWLELDYDLDVIEKQRKVILSIKHHK